MIKTGFLITAYDQTREVRFTVHMLRNLWTKTKDTPVVVVISGDSNFDVEFRDDPFTRTIHLDDMVRDRFQVLVSTSIMKQIKHGMIEMRDLEREHGRIDNIIHMHGDILLLGEKGFWQELEQWKRSGKPIAADPVGAQGPYFENLFGKDYTIKFCGAELMPQIFAVDHGFCKRTGYMYNMSVQGDMETISTEWALIGNLHRATHIQGCGEAYRPYFNGAIDSKSPYIHTYESLVYPVKEGRPQWGLHNHWGGFTHFGNSIHYTKEHREARNEMALRQYGLDLTNW